MRAPKSPRFQVVPISKSSSIPVQVFDAYLRLFHTVISPVDGARSAMYPTGSAYARQAFAKHRRVAGIRSEGGALMHEGNERLVAPRIRKHGRWRIYDPLEANDRWWHKPGPAGIGDSQ